MSASECIVNVEDEEFAPRVSFHRIRRSVSLPFSPLTPLSHKSSSYSQLPEQPLRLSVIKLDGSSFDIQVSKQATIADLKQAVETAFSHMPKKGPGKISWPHVWGHFCLCYDGQKLVRDTDCIRNYGIKDDDQLQFVRHVSFTYNLVKKRSKKRVFILKQGKKSLPRSNSIEMEKQVSEQDDDFEDIERGKNQHHLGQDETSISRHQSDVGCCLKGLLPYTRLGTSGKSRPRGKTPLSKFTYLLFGRCRKVIWLFADKRHYKR